MTSRKSRRGSCNTSSKMKKGAKKQLILMIISVVLMIFTVTQVYYLAKYTLGLEVKQEDLKVYRWICMLFEEPQEATAEE